MIVTASLIISSLAIIISLASLRAGSRTIADLNRRMDRLYDRYDLGVDGKPAERWYPKVSPPA